MRADLAPKIAQFLAERALNPPPTELSKIEPGTGRRVWQTISEAFPHATAEELHRGTMIALELLLLEAAQIDADIQQLRDQWP